MHGLFFFDWVVVSLNVFLVLGCLVWSTPMPQHASSWVNGKSRRYSVALGAARSRWFVAVTACLVIIGGGYLGNYLPFVKAMAFEHALTSRLDTWEECQNAFDASFLPYAPYGQDELVRRFGSSVSKLLRDRAKNPVNVAMGGLFPPLCRCGLARKGVNWVRTLESAGAVETAAFQVTQDPVYFSAAERYYRQGLDLNPVNLTLLYGQFDLYSAAGRKHRRPPACRTDL